MQLNEDHTSWEGYIHNGWWYHFSPPEVTHKHTTAPYAQKISYCVNQLQRLSLLWIPSIAVRRKPSLGDKWNILVKHQSRTERCIFWQWSHFLSKHFFSLFLQPRMLNHSTAISDWDFHSCLTYIMRWKYSRNYGQRNYTFSGISTWTHSWSTGSDIFSRL